MQEATILIKLKVSSIYPLRERGRTAFGTRACGCSPYLPNGFEPNALKGEGQTNCRPTPACWAPRLPASPMHAGRRECRGGMDVAAW